MSISATNSSVYVDYTSFFSQGGNKTFSAFQATALNYGNGEFQVRRASAITLDVLDLSAEGLAKADELKPTELADTDGTSDVTLKTPEISEADRVEMIRVNKNAVLARVNEILADKGIELSSNQSFELTTNFIDGSISVSGIDDPELIAAVNEALAGDEELIARMKKTREELGLEEPANTVARNFTIGFDSMLETPADAELEYKIDLFINQPVPLLEDGSNVEETPQTDESQTLAQRPQAPLYFSIFLSNKPKLDPALSLLESLADTKIANDKETEEVDDDEIAAKVSTPDFIPDEEEQEETTIVPAESVKEIPTFSAFGATFSFFSASSTVNINENGMTLDWNVQFSNGTLNTQAETNSTQRIFETLNIAGSSYYAADPNRNPAEQAALLQSRFSNESGSDWVQKFIAYNSLNLSPSEKAV